MAALIAQFGFAPVVVNRPEHEVQRLAVAYSFATRLTMRNAAINGRHAAPGPPIPFPDGYRALEIAWQAAPSPSTPTGTFSLKLDGKVE